MVGGLSSSEIVVVPHQGVFGKGSFVDAALAESWNMISWNCLSIECYSTKQSLAISASNAHVTHLLKTSAR